MMLSGEMAGVAEGGIRWRYLAVLGAAVLFFVVSCAPGLLWQDSGMIQYRVWDNDIEGGLGLALSHPLFYIIAIAVKYVPVGAFAFKVNLVSAIAAAVAVANLYLLLRLLVGRDFPAVIGALSLAVSHTFWRHGAIAETYTLYTAILLAELVVLLRYEQSGRVCYLYWLGLLSGLAISDHMLASIPFLCYSVFIVVLLGKNEIGFKNLGIIVLLWIVGAVPYEYLIIKNLIQTGDLVGVLRSAAFGNSWADNVLNTSLSFRIVKENILFFALNFPTPNVLLFFVGCWTVSKIVPSRRFRNVLICLVLLFLVFAFRYTVVDRYAFFMPFYCLVSVFMGLGVYSLCRRVKSKALVYVILIFSLLPIPVYAAAPIVAGRLKLNLGTNRQIPFRDEYSFFLQPWKTGYHGAGRFANNALETVEDGGVIYADGTTVYPLLLRRETGGKGQDVIVVSGHGSVNNLGRYGEEKIDELFGEHSVYVVSPVERYCHEFLLERYDFVQDGVLYRAVAKD